MRVLAETGLCQAEDEAVPARLNMELYTKIVSGLLFPLHEAVKRHDSVAIRKAMEVSQWWSPAEIRAHQLERLKVLLRRAREHVPYYRETLDGVDFEAWEDVSELSRLPFLTKAIITGNLERMKADDAVGLARFNTGGSSGVPLIFFIGRERVSHDVAAKWRATRWWDVDIGDREIVVWGSPVELGAQDRMREWRDRLLRTRLIPAFEMSRENLDRFVEEIRRFRPRMLFGYPSSLSRIARHAREQGQRMDDLGIRVAFVTSERLYDDQKRTIEQVFGCPVANGYGGRDAGFIAHQCPAGGMHITAEDIIVEIVDAKGNVLPPGQAGEVVVTHLATGDFPFIRYRTGDVAVLSEAACSCGRGLPLLEEIQGRTTDFVMARDGTLMHGLALIYVLRDIEGIEQFKIIQHTLEHTGVQIVAGTNFDPADEKRIREVFAQRLGEGVQVDIEYVDAIPAEKSGKFRYVISHVAGSRPGEQQAGDGA